MTAPSPNRTYQQLRAHLAFLKLNAAAEALAGGNVKPIWPHCDSLIWPHPRRGSWLR